MLSVFVSSSSLHAESQDSPDCLKALDSADVLIKKQQELSEKLTQILEEKTNENERLDKALVQMKELSDESFHINIAVGAVGIVVGVLVMGLVKK